MPRLPKPSHRIEAPNILVPTGEVAQKIGRIGAVQTNINVVQVPFEHRPIEIDQQVHPSEASIRESIKWLHDNPEPPIIRPKL